MAATKYQIFYRYINKSTGNPITNNMGQEYEETLEFYTDRHKINIGTDEEKMEEEERREKLIVDGNTANNPKMDMMFVYGGTTKVNHKIYLGNNRWQEKTGVPNGVNGVNVPGGYPYLIKDVYIRVPMSPWCKGPVYSSLNAALERCKSIALAIGIENVKLIKIVPYDQKIKIV